MSNRRNLIWLLVLVLLASVAAGFFVYPKGYVASLRPWRLGLDLVGGSHLTYEVDLKEGAYSQYYVSCSYEGQGCGYSGIVPIQVIGDTYEIPSNIFADFTQDVEVNFIDFSFMRSAFLSSQSILFYDLDEDGDLTLKDFSLLDYQWTR